MKTGRRTAVAASFILLSLPTLAQDNHDPAKQAQLDQACQDARQARILPMREQAMAECVQKGKDKAYCERFYQDYGERSPQGRPAFYDLPECVQAFEYQKKENREF